MMANRDRIDRRRFLRLGALGGATLAAGAAGAGCLDPGETVKSGPSHPADGVIDKFHSRPDLTPPRIEIDVHPGDVDPGYVVTDCHDGPGQQGPIMLNSSGALTWFRPLSSGATPSLRAFNTRIQRYQGEPVLSWFQGAVVAAHGQGHYVIVDTRYRPVKEVHAANGYLADLHEFLITGRGTALFTCYGRGVADLSSLGGSARGPYFYGVVQEVEIATGKLLFEWRSDHHVGFDESYLHPNPRGIPWDYFHVNSISIDPADGNLVISGRNTWACYKVHRPSGAVLWRLGGKKSDFSIQESAHFAFQHDVVAHSHGVFTVFDNEAGPPAEASSSRGLYLRVDERARHVSLERALTHHPNVLSPSLGSVQPLPGGHTFMGWGTSSYFTEYAADGKVLFDGHFAPGTRSYRAFKSPWVGRPATPPSVAAVLHDKHTVIWASWNGATEVAAWRVLAGSARDSLGRIGVAKRYGFETRIVTGRRHHYVALQALDRENRVLGRSKTVAVTGS